MLLLMRGAPRRSRRWPVASSRASRKSTVASQCNGVDAVAGGQRRALQRRAVDVAGAAESRRPDRPDRTSRSGSERDQIAHPVAIQRRAGRSVAGAATAAPTSRLCACSGLIDATRETRKVQVVERPVHETRCQPPRRDVKAGSKVDCDAELAGADAAIDRVAIVASVSLHAPGAERAGDSRAPAHRVWRLSGAGEDTLASTLLLEGRSMGRARTAGSSIGRPGSSASVYCCRRVLKRLGSLSTAQQVVGLCGDSRTVVDPARRQLAASSRAIATRVSRRLRKSPRRIAARRSAAEIRHCRTGSAGDWRRGSADCGAPATTA